MNLLMELKVYVINSEITVEHPCAVFYCLNRYCCRQLLKIGLSNLSKDSISSPNEADSQDYHIQEIYF